MTINTAILEMTGKDSVHWLHRIGELVHKYTDHNSNLTQSNLWVRDLSDELWPLVRDRIDLLVADENIAFSRILSLILALWTARIIHAKAHDPRRPVKIRQEMMDKFTHYGKLLVECLTGQSLDRLHFPSQEWKSPYEKEAL